MLAGGLGLILCNTATILPAEAGSQLVQGSEKRVQTKTMQLVLTCDKVKASMEDRLDMYVAIVNVGLDPFYVLRQLEWGDAGGVQIYVRDDENGKFVGPLNDQLWPPPPADDPNLLVRLDHDMFYGTRTSGIAKILVRHPGKYHMMAVYHCPYSRALYHDKVGNLNAFWSEDPEVHSNKVSLEVVP